MAMMDWIFFFSVLCPYALFCYAYMLHITYMLSFTAQCLAKENHICGCETETLKGRVDLLCTHSLHGPR